MPEHLRRYVLRRCAWSLVTLLGITLLSFGLLRAAHADPLLARMQDPQNAGRVSMRALEQLRTLYDLDQPWYVQYAKLLQRFATLDLGTRWQDGRPIRDVLAEALPITLTLTAAALALAYLLAIPIGVYAAAKRGRAFDHVVSSSSSLLFSLPAFWVGTLLLLFLASGQFVTCPQLPHAACFPLQGWHSFAGFERMTPFERLRDLLWHGVLPVVTLAYPAFAVLSRHMRAATLETLRLDYVRTARAKGLSGRTVLWRHVLRNSLLPMITLLGLELPQLVSGSVVVESVFGIRGMGLIALEAMRMPDYPMAITVVTLTAVFTLFGSLLADILHALLDPRLRVQP
ncbi:MAG: hypothetical protein RL701_4920 [Pseudomonadota bacterium]